MSGDNNNFEGSYECVCVNGFQRHPKNQRCVDIDECNSESSEGLCNDPYECSNTIGSYKCVCSAGLVQVKDFKCILMHFLWFIVRTEVVWFSFIHSVKLFDNPQKFKGMVAMLMNAWISTNVWT